MAQVKFKRDTQTNILNTTLYPIVDGQLLFATDTGAIYEDVGINRIPCGGSVNIVDNLTSTSAVAVLSANQGRVLNTTKLSTANIIAGTNITTSVSGNNVTINSLGGGVTTVVVDNLTSTSPTSALSANQGRVLNEGKVDKITTINSKPLTNNVVLNANDVGALSSSTVIPTKTSQLINDSSFVNQTALDAKLSTANIVAGANIKTTTSGNNVTISADIPFVKKVVTTASMWSGTASPYVLTITDTSIAQTSWIDIYGFSDADKSWITTNLITYTPILASGNFKLNFSAQNTGLTIAYSIKEVI